jgi:hypothetical protein
MNTLVPDLAFSVIPAVLSHILLMLSCANLTLWYMSAIRSLFSRRLITCNFSRIPIVFHQSFTWIELGDVYVCFSLTLVRKANAVEEETR